MWPGMPGKLQDRVLSLCDRNLRHNLHIVGLRETSIVVEQVLAFLGRESFTQGILQGGAEREVPAHESAGALGKYPFFRWDIAFRRVVARSLRDSTESSRDGVTAPLLEKSAHSSEEGCLAFGGERDDSPIACLIPGAQQPHSNAQNAALCKDYGRTQKAAGSQENNDGPPVMSVVPGENQKQIGTQIVLLTYPSTKIIRLGNCNKDLSNTPKDRGIIVVSVHRRLSAKVDYRFHALSSGGLKPRSIRTR